MKLNRTTLRTVEILQLISKNSDGLTLDEICEQLELPKTSAYDIVATLVSTGMAHMVQGDKKRYQIGLTSFRIGINYTNHMRYMDILSKELKDFAKEINKTVFFGVRSEEEVIYLYKAEPENPIITTATVGTKNPIHCTSLGKVILAFCEKHEKDELLDKIDLVKRTERTITNKSVLTAQLKEIEKKGYALDEREVEDHMECVGAPVFDASKQLIGAISVSSLYRDDEDYDSLGKVVSSRAKLLSKQLGFCTE